MYILMISRGYPSKEFPQWGCFEQDQAEALSNSGHKVVVLSIDGRFLWKFRKIGVTHYYKNGVNYYNCFWHPGVLTDLISRKLSLISKRKQIDLLYKKVESLYGKPDVIYGQFFFNTAVGVYLRNKYNIPLVGIEHAGRFNSDTLDSYTQELASYAYKNVDGIITVSSTLQQRLLYHFHVNSTVVHNLVNPCFFELDKSVETTSSFCFISTGSLVYGKGFDLLITAFAKLYKIRSDVKLIIIGEGEEHQKLQAQVDELGVSEAVHLVGQKTKDEIVNLLQKSSAFILPSRSENFSVAVLEALAIGLPVIATLCGGIRECIHEKNGLLVPTDDADSLFEAMHDVYLNMNKYNREEISMDCYNHFSPKVIASELVNTFKLAINKHKDLCSN